MKNIYFFTALTFLLFTNKMQSQNEILAVWKNGAIIYQISTNPAAMDSITFIPPLPIGEDEVAICNQVWQTRNLDVSTYRNGDPIPQVTDPAIWNSLTTGAWCYYNNDPVNGTIYGKLYNAYAVNDPRGLAPQGWHVPTEAEWTTLVDCLGGPNIAGGKMKAIGFDYWVSPNTAATNSSGFTALGAGKRNEIGTFSEFNRYAEWWSSPQTTYTLHLDHNSGATFNYYNLLKRGESVRCVRD